MGAKIPRSIKVEVIRKWLEGKSRDQIAKELQIGFGTVSGIIKESRDNDPEFELLRALAVKLRDQGYDVQSFAHAVRLREVLKQKGGLLDTTKEGHEEQVQEKIEALMMGLEVFCFKQDFSIMEFVNLVHDLSWTAEILGVPLDKLPSYVKLLEGAVHRLTREIEQKKSVFQDYGATINSLEEFRRNRPLLDKFQEVTEELEKVKQQRDSCERERMWKQMESRHTWAIPEGELIEANKKLSSGGSYVVQALSPQELKRMVMDVYTYPSKYVEVIRQIINIYGLENK
jgi:transcriptional regulator with XRE-family HTH domain